MPEIKYKYRLTELVEGLPKSKNTEWVIEELEKEGIARRTFFRDKSLALTDEADIPAERLLIYKEFFGVELDELFNYSKKVKPASKRNVA